MDFFTIEQMNSVAAALQRATASIERLTATARLFGSALDRWLDQEFAALPVHQQRRYVVLTCSGMPTIDALVKARRWQL